MTYSEKERLGHCRNALEGMLRLLGDGAIAETVFDPKEGRLEDIVKTTWTDLCDEKWLESAEIQGRYRLTGFGWLQALRITGELKKEEFTRRLANACASMKSYVEGRRDPAVVRLGDLAGKANVPEGWLFNFIESRFVEEFHGRKGPHWDKRMVFIPAEFEMAPLDLDSLLVNEAEGRIAELQAKIDEIREQLKQYRCPYCGSALSSSGPVPLSEHHEGYFETFECGYCRVDGFEKRLCPSDPKFPKLEELDLTTMQRGGEWYCIAVAKTDNARKIELLSGYANTEEEAKQRVVERYRYIKGELKWNQVWPFSKA